MSYDEFLRLTHAAVKDTNGTVWSLPAPCRHEDVRRVMREYGAEPRENDRHFAEGFLDQHGKFWHRKAAVGIAFASGQAKDTKVKGLLTSEDLW